MSGFYGLGFGEFEMKTEEWFQPANITVEIEKGGQVFTYKMKASSLAIIPVGPSSKSLQFSAECFECELITSVDSPVLEKKTITDNWRFYEKVVEKAQE